MILLTYLKHRAKGSQATEDAAWEGSIKRLRLEQVDSLLIKTGSAFVASITWIRDFSPSFRIENDFRSGQLYES